MKMFLYLAVFLGGGLGAALRLALQQFFSSFSGYVPYVGILVANLIGCFCLGFFYSFTAQWPEAKRLLLTTGFLGGLTTFSGFSFDINTLQSQHSVAVAAVFFCAHIIGGLLACRLGLLISRYQLL